MRNQGNPHSNFTIDWLPRDRLIDVSQCARVFLQAFWPLHWTGVVHSVQSLPIQRAISITHPSSCKKTFYFLISLAIGLQSSQLFHTENPNFLSSNYQKASRSLIWVFKARTRWLVDALPPASKSDRINLIPFDEFWVMRRLLVWNFLPCRWSGFWLFHGLNSAVKSKPELSAYKLWVHFPFAKSCLECWDRLVFYVCLQAHESKT